LVTAVLKLMIYYRARKGLYSFQDTIVKKLAIMGAIGDLWFTQTA
jgi:hypothetical protein